MNLPAPLNRHFKGSIFYCSCHPLCEGGMGDANRVCELIDFLLLEGHSLAAGVRICFFTVWYWSSAQCCTKCCYSSISLRSKAPSPQTVLCSRSLHKGVGCNWNYLLWGGGMGAKRLEWKSPREPLCVCKGWGTWKQTGSELIAGLLRYKWEQD